MVETDAACKVACELADRVAPSPAGGRLGWGLRDVWSVNSRNYLGWISRYLSGLSEPETVNRFKLAGPHPSLPPKRGRSQTREPDQANVQAFSSFVGASSSSDCPAAGKIAPSWMKSHLSFDWPLGLAVTVYISCIN